MFLIDLFFLFYFTLMIKTNPILSKFIRSLTFACACFLSANLYATHITGGELTYECLSSNTYKINLKLYRDCLSGEAGFDDPARITIWSGTGTYLQVIELPYMGATYLPYVAADTNWVPTGYACVEVAVYTDTVVSTISPSGYIFAYQRCCRTNSIVNLVISGNQGSTYWEEVQSVALCNNSPAFNDHPPLVLCFGRPMTFDHSATDPDGDSLVYYLCNSYDGASPSDPQPYVTSQPPFPNVTYILPYSYSNPLQATPAFSIDSITGIVTVTPTLMGEFMAGICCDEYRGGVLIGSHHSDFRYTVAYCPYGIGIEEELAISVEVFPNPARDMVQIKTDQEVNIMVFDMLGKLVYQSTTSNQIHNINLSEWARGVYTYRLFAGEGMSSGKFIKNE